MVNLGYRWNKLGLSLSGQGKFVRKQDRVLHDNAFAYPAQHGYSLYGLFLGWRPQGPAQGPGGAAGGGQSVQHPIHPYLTEGAEGMGRAIRTSVSWRF